MQSEQNFLAVAKGAIQDMVALDAIADYRDWRETAMMSGDITEMRKVVEFQAKVIGVEAERKVDPNANLPVFNFTFHAPTGTMSATITHPEEEQPLEMLQDLAASRSVRAAPMHTDEVVQDAEVKVRRASMASHEMPDDLTSLLDTVPRE